MPSAYILTIGSELTSGAQVDSNSGYLARRLAEIGLVCHHIHSVCDEQSAIVHSVGEGLALADHVLITGGLGPTDDDITRQSVAKALGRALILDEEYATVLRERFGVRSEKQLRQAMRPEGSTFITVAAAGTAPGFRYRSGDKVVWVMPGVPSEMKEMFESAVAPELLAAAPGPAPISRTYRLCGLGEVEAEDRMSALLRGRVPLSILPKLGEIHLKVSADAALITELDRSVEQAFPVELYGLDEESLPASLGRLLKGRGLTLGTVESCTGGLASQLLTEVPGSSEYFVGAIVSYSNAVKSGVAGVPAHLIEEHGAVSEEVAIAMAECGRRSLGSDLCVAITGVAGPDGGSPEKPVGLVYIALSWDGGSRCIRQEFMGDRAAIRLRSAKRALNMVRVFLCA